MSTHQPDNNPGITSKVKNKTAKKLLKFITYHDRSDHSLSYYEYAGYAIVYRHSFWTVHNQMQITPRKFYAATYTTPEEALSAIINYEE